MQHWLLNAQCTANFAVRSCTHCQAALSRKSTPECGDLCPTATHFQEQHTPLSCYRTAIDQMPSRSLHSSVCTTAIGLHTDEQPSTAMWMPGSRPVIKQTTTALEQYSWESNPEAAVQTCHLSSTKTVVIMQKEFISMLVWTCLQQIMSANRDQTNKYPPHLHAGTGRSGATTTAPCHCMGPAVTLLHRGN